MQILPPQPIASTSKSQPSSKQRDRRQTTFEPNQTTKSFGSTPKSIIKATQDSGKGKERMVEKGKGGKGHVTDKGRARVTAKQAPGTTATTMNQKRFKAGERRRKLQHLQETRRDTLKAALRERLGNQGKKPLQKLRTLINQPTLVVQTPLGEGPSSGLPSKIKRKVSKSLLVEDDEVQTQKKRKLLTPPIVATPDETLGMKVTTVRFFISLLNPPLTCSRF